MSGPEPTSLSTAAARQLASVTKSPPYDRAISPRWLLRMLPWVEARGGVYRVNRRLRHVPGQARLSCFCDGAEVRLLPQSLVELAPLRGLSDVELLGALAGCFVQREVEPGSVIAQAGAVQRLLVLARGKAEQRVAGNYGEPSSRGVISAGMQLGAESLVRPGVWDVELVALTPCTVLELDAAAFEHLLASAGALRAQLDAVRARPAPAVDKFGQAQIALAAGHTGEPTLPHTFVDYELRPRELELAAVQTVLRVHTRVVDLYSHPMDQLEQQLRLTVEALRERQEHELLHDRSFGLLHAAALDQRITSRGGPPTPDDLDLLLSRRRRTDFMLAHPQAIAAFGRECSRRGLVPSSAEIDDARISTWRGVPLLPCDKLPIDRHQTTSILAMRTGEAQQGVIGLHQTGLPDEREPGVSVRLMNVDDTAVISYLVTTYQAAAVLVPDALGVLEQVEVGR